MVIVIVRFHNPKIHLVRNPQVVLFTTYDPHLVRIHLVRKIFWAIFRTKWGPPVLTILLYFIAIIFCDINEIFQSLWIEGKKFYVVNYTQSIISYYSVLRLLAVLKKIIYIPIKYEMLELFSLLNFCWEMLIICGSFFIWL